MIRVMMLVGLLVLLAGCAVPQVVTEAEPIPEAMRVESVELEPIVITGRVIALRRWTNHTKAVTTIFFKYQSRIVVYGHWRLELGEIYIFSLQDTTNGPLWWPGNADYRVLDMQGGRDVRDD